LVAGALSLAIEGPSRVDITCDDNKRGLCRVCYVTQAEGEYHVIIKFDGQNIIGSPFKALIYGGYLAKVLVILFMLCGSVACRV